MAIIQETNVNLATHVRDVLNAAGGSVSNDVTTFFKAGANIDMWSRYKPMVIAGIPFLNLWDKMDSTRYYYQGVEGKCGLSYDVYTDAGTFKSELVRGTTGWSYTPPKGGTSEPMRLGDFRRYCTTAINPLGAIPSNHIATRLPSGDSVQLDIGVNVPVGTTYNLGISDFYAGSIPFSDMYLGVYLVRKGDSTGRFITSENTIGTNGVMSIVFPLNYGEGGTYIAYMFLSSVVQDGINEKDGTFVSIGGTAMNGAGQEISIQAAGTLYTITAYASATANTKEYYYEVTLENKNNSSVTFKDVYMQIMHDMNDGNGWSPEGRAILLAEEVVVPANSSKVYDGSRNDHSAVFDTNGLNKSRYGIYAYSGTPQITGATQPIEPSEPMELSL